MNNIYKRGEKSENAFNNSKSVNWVIDQFFTIVALK